MTAPLEGEIELRLSLAAIQNILAALSFTADAFSEDESPDSAQVKEVLSAIYGFVLDQVQQGA